MVISEVESKGVYVSKRFFLLFLLSGSLSSLSLSQPSYCSESGEKNQIRSECGKKKSTIYSRLIQPHRGLRLKVATSKSSVVNIRHRCQIVFSLFQFNTDNLVLKMTFLSFLTEASLISVRYPHST